MYTRRPVILMRPGEANNRLAELLSAQGIQCWRWPAFTITMPPDPAAVEARLARLDDVDMVILPSPAAVAAVAHWVRTWPAHVTLATVGEGTARVIQAAWGDEVKLLYPEGEAEHSGSEALWELVKARGAPARVLFLRGQTGREWLPEQFRQMGSDVEKVCAYQRVPLELSEEQQLELANATVGPPPIVFVTSTDSVDVLMHAARPVYGAQDWIARGAAIALHPRIVARLKEAGFVHVDMTPADDAEVVDHIVRRLAQLG